MKKLIFTIFIALLLQSLPASAESCKKLSEQEAIDSYETIFIGRPLETHTNKLRKWLPKFFKEPDSTTTFQVLRTYKHNSEDQLKIQHYTASKTGRSIIFDKDTDYIVFINQKGLGSYIYDFCSPTAQLVEGEVNMLYSKLEEYIGDLHRHEDLIIKAYYEDRRSIEDLYTKYPNPEYAERLKEQYQNKSECGDIFASYEHTPFFLKNFPSPVPDNHYMNKRDSFLEYGQALYKLGRYKESLRPFCLASPKKAEVIFWQTLALSKLGLYKKDLSNYIDASKIVVSNVHLNGLDLGSFDFNQSKLTSLSMIETDLSGSNFSSAKLEKIEAGNAKFINTDFSNSSLNANFSGADFTRSNLINAEFKNSNLVEASFYEADLKGADFGRNKLKDLKGIKLENAIFNEDTMWPAGFSPFANGGILVGDSTISRKYPARGELHINNRGSIAAIEKQSRNYFPVRNEIHIGNESEGEILRLIGSGTYLVDGIHIKNYGRIYADNGQPNLIKIYSSALMGRTYKYNIGKNNTEKSDPFKKLRIQGDAYADAVQLDGCVEWVLPVNEGPVTGFYTPANGEKTVSVTLHKYMSAASSGKPIEILIQDGLSVSFSKDCEAQVSAENTASLIQEASEPLTEGKQRSLALLKQKALSLEERWALASPPNLINSPPLPESIPGCPAGDLVFREAGFYNLEIPSGCRRILVKAWGAGGGGSQGGPGGFTMGIIEISKDANIDAIVGGGGKNAVKEKFGAGGFNGGGDGGDGSGTHQAFIGGSGGGGRTELLINGKPVLIAGGGGGAGRQSRGYPGGGRNSKDIENYYSQKKAISNSIEQIENIAGSNGIGGKAAAGYEMQNDDCIPATDGEEKNGGRGAIARAGCGAAGGGGGGAGYGGGAGGRHDTPGYGGGGGGLAPEYGITVWGRANGHLPANVDDLYHNAFSGREGKDGLIAIIWPGPDGEDFLKIVANHASDITPFIKDKSKPELLLGNKQIRISGIELMQLPDATERKKTFEDIKSSNAVEYVPDNDMNISIYKKWIGDSNSSQLLAHKGIIDLMQAGKLPTEFLRSGTEYGVGDDAYILMQLTPEFFKKSETAFSNDKIHILSDANIVFLESGWGHHQIEESCNESSRGKPVYAPRSSHYFSGLGIGLHTNDKQILVSKIFPNMPGEKSGLKEGDFIIAIEGKNAAGMDLREAIGKLKGPIGTPVKITYESHAYGQSQEMTLIRDYVELPRPKIADELIKTNYQAPYEYPDFLIFDSDINPEDMIWEGERKLVNKKTGDRIEFPSYACFNFIFFEDGKAPTVPPALIRTVETLSAEEKGKSYEDYQAIPKLLQPGIRTQTTLKKYLQNIESSFTKITSGKTFFDKTVLQDIEDNAVKDAIKQQRSSILNYDDDFDGKVTLEEMTAYFDKKYVDHSEQQKKERLDNFISTNMALDRNGDKIIAGEEILILDAEKKQKIKEYLSKAYEAYFELDSDKDDVLTLSELKALAEKAFSTVDLDKDSVISNEEYSAFRNGKKTIVTSQLGSNDNLEDTEADKIAKTTSAIKSIDAATSTFRDMYAAFPGDMVNAEKRIPNCAPNLCGSGNGDGVVGNFELHKIDLARDERHLFWIHLRKVDLLSGYDADTKEATWGSAFPASPLGGGFHVYSYNGTDKFPHTFEGTSARSGLYLILTNDIHGDFSSLNSHFLTAEQAGILDRKLDDGLPLTGAVISAGDKKCLEEKNGTLNYKQKEESENQEKCLSLYIRIQSYGASRNAVPPTDMRPP